MNLTIPRAPRLLRLATLYLGLVFLGVFVFSWGAGLGFAALLLMGVPIDLSDPQILRMVGFSMYVLNPLVVGFALWKGWIRLKETP
jgi:hypothetical protein